ncbi:MAG: hypothetical protein ACREP9_18275 [Candidatus Dormibacteraceae bacterium]
MNSKEHFLNAVQILAPGDEFMLQAATEVPEESLPAAPGGMALEFVVALQRENPPVFPCRSRLKSSSHRNASTVKEAIDFSLQHALKLKAAEFWLRLGDPAQALIEIQTLSEKLQKHPQVLKVQLTAIGAMRESTSVQA